MTKLRKGTQERQTLFTVAKQTLEKKALDHETLKDKKPRMTDPIECQTLLK